MHSNVWAQVRAFGAIVTLVTFAAAPAGADNVEDELKQMRELVLQLQDQVNDQQSQIEEQSDVIRDAGLEDRSSGSKLSSFLETTDFGGSIAASYFYNFNNPKDGNLTNSGPAGGSVFPGGMGTNTGDGHINPFHPDHNSIQLDEAWLSMSRAPSDESPVGFGLDLVYGALGEINGNSGSGGGNGFWLNQAYIDYMARGVTLTAGKFATHIGYEVAGAANNVMVTRGLTYQRLQPVSQIGAKLSGDIGPIGLMIGVTNGLGENQVDLDRNKDVIWQVGWSNDTLTVLFNGEYGGDSEFFVSSPTNDDDVLVLDWVLEFAPTDAIVTWVNYTWVNIESETGVGLEFDETDWGLNVGGRVGLGERAGVGGRFELGEFSDFGSTSVNDESMWSITGTFDYLLAEGLTMKTEIQYVKSKIDFAPNDFFPDDSIGGFDNDQLILGVQLVYAF
jgi:hypothetical protein